MRVISCFLLIFISLHAAPAGAASATGKKYFDMPVKEWLGLSEGEKIEGTRELLSLNNTEVSRGRSNRLPPA